MTASKERRGWDYWGERETGLETEDLEREREFRILETFVSALSARRCCCPKPQKLPSFSRAEGRRRRKGVRFRKKCDANQW